ncbi:protein of unknown function [Mucilaginibacter lappiensis]|uniref:DUF3560 domain-containing protein n=1 Tax=Mucilaginibacter lappiensis TaxID=354630 RepID=A0ABR6PG82_9SPHI|nr:DUF3560 domain-containing protein [Mucilaginibacter lappiensis]MBB6108666.1 hypothetical protein [Mucilaginibacter lappiensis]SIQ28661.1 protein of unknown function [Mucilaginibacter lappiensis]
MKHDFEQRRERRINNAKNRAIKNEQEAECLYQTAKKQASFIPMGQPILIGHHSEKRDRNFRERIHNTFGKSFEKSEKAEYYAEKAESIENNTAIFSDDPNALAKLTKQLTDLKEIQEFMKAANKCIKKQDKEAFLKLNYGIEKLWEQLSTGDYLRRLRFAPFKLTNNGSNIRRIEQRIEQLKKQQTKVTTDKTINGLCIFENTEANRLQLIFEDKPSPEIRQQLKANGFRWSPTEGAWQRHISNYALYSAERIAESLSN